MSEAPYTPAPVMFTVGGASFTCVEFVPHWNVMRLASAMNSGDEMKALAVMHDFILRLVVDKEKDALDAHLSELDLERTDLDEAIGNALVGMAGRGKVSGPPVGVPPLGSTLSETSSGPSLAGFTEMSPTRRVVSFSRGTVEMVGPDETDSSTE